jgi:hypothetical protein
MGETVIRIVAFGLLLALLELAPAAVRSASMGTQDAPKCAWWSPAWNVDKAKFRDVEKKFGPATKWQNGDAICGVENAGYQWNTDKGPRWVVFFEGELGTGIRVSYSLPTTATLGYASTCERPNPAGQILPKGPFPVLTGFFETPILLGTSRQKVLEQLGTPRSTSTEADGTEMISFYWDCRECKYDFPGVGELEGVQTGVTAGFRKNKLVHYEFDRSWGL